MPGIQFRAGEPFPGVWVAGPLPSAGAVTRKPGTRLAS